MRVRYLQKRPTRIRKSVNCLYDNHSECSGEFYTYGRMRGWGYWVGVLVRCDCECHQTE